MKDYISSLLQKEPGLYLCELPTGYGKTYNVVQAMREYRSDPKHTRKIIYLTTLNKNLPEKELLAAFGNDEEAYHRNVLRIRANLDEVTEKLESLEIPEEFQTKSYDQLLDLVQHYNRAIANHINDQRYIQELCGDMDKAEGKFHHEITNRLKREFRNKQRRLNAIRSDCRWKWAGLLYPAVFTDEHPILLMSISKFMRRNTTLVEDGYDFLKSSLINDAVIFIDEFDATKATIQDVITEKALESREEYLSLFRQIYRGLNPKYLSRDMTDAFQDLGKDIPRRYTFGRIREEAEDIEERYAVYLSYKTAEESIDRRQNFLLKDATYHTLFHNDKGYIRAAKNDAENRVDIFFESKKDFYTHMRESKDGNIVVYGLLREINRFLNHFREFLFLWARQYMQDVNAHRNPKDDEMTLENALSSILNKFELSENGKKLVLSEVRSSSVNHKKKELLPDNSFYQQGMEIFELEEQDSHHDSTNLRLVAMYDTPEKILSYLSEKATVVGISATAEVSSVIGNYDLDYLREKLGDQFHTTPDETKRRIAAIMAENWKAYEDGRIKIHAEVIKNGTVNFDADSTCKTFFQSEELANICASLIRNTIASEYHELRYCNIVRAMHCFCKESIQSMLFLGMALPKRNNPELDEDLLSRIFQLVIEDTSGSDGNMNRMTVTPESLCILRSSNFDSAKADLMERLCRGEKLFILSTYQTLGAGQNLQYPAPDKENLIELVPYQNDGDQRHFFKDIDAIYLSDVTNLTANTYSENNLTLKELCGMLIQIEELLQNAELSYEEADNMIKLAFRAYTGRGHMERNLLYHTDSVKLQATRQVMQAVGRMCRTYLKSPDIYLYIEERLLDKLSAGELKKHILPPEMQAIVTLRETLGAEYTNEEARILRRAEKNSNYERWNIRQILSRHWTQDSMNLWIALRQAVLMHPTASCQLHEQGEIFRKTYITSGHPQNRYFYSQYADFSNVTIDFGNDAIAFRNSGRAKKKADGEEVLVYEMSEKESGLPVILEYPGMRDFFTRADYATAFEEDDYMMSPVLFHNIYKGVLGEVAGKYILKQELGIELEDITDPSQFEFFDYLMAPGVYVDFKNWKFSYTQDRQTTLREISWKMDELGAKRAYIINMIGDPEQYVPTVSIDARIIEIPCLLDRNGRPVSKCLKMIREEDLR